MLSEHEYMPIVAQIKDSEEMGTQYEQVDVLFLRAQPQIK